MLPLPPVKTRTKVRTSNSKNPLMFKINLVHKQLHGVRGLSGNTIGQILGNQMMVRTYRVCQIAHLWGVENPS